MVQPISDVNHIPEYSQWVLVESRGVCRSHKFLLRDLVAFAGTGAPNYDFILTLDIIPFMLNLTGAATGTFALR